MGGITWYNMSCTSMSNATVLQKGVCINIHGCRSYHVLYTEISGSMTMGTQWIYLKVILDVYDYVAVLMHYTPIYAVENCIIYVYKG